MRNYMLGARLWNAFLHSGRAVSHVIAVFFHPDFDILAANPEREKQLAKDADDVELPEPEEKVSDYMVTHESYPKGLIDRSSFSIPEGFIIRKPVYLYIRIEDDEPRYWELPLPAGSTLHVTAFRKPDWAVSHQVERFDNSDDDN